MAAATPAVRKRIRRGPAAQTRAPSAATCRAKNPGLLRPKTAPAAISRTARTTSGKTNEGCSRRARRSARTCSSAAPSQTKRRPSCRRTKAGRGSTSRRLTLEWRTRWAVKAWKSGYAATAAANERTSPSRRKKRPVPAAGLAGRAWMRTAAAVRIRKKTTALAKNSAGDRVSSRNDLKPARAGEKRTIRVRSQGVRAGS